MNLFMWVFSLVLILSFSSPTASVACLAVHHPGPIVDTRPASATDRRGVSSSFFADVVGPLIWPVMDGNAGYSATQVPVQSIPALPAGCQAP